uniref:Uncharacterized protein n=2 Tax=Meloidogyne enterolobii TaxID=390850 RepID=A0A6V7XDX7_MELEN|nr:unnamed protein product [Meloidogyne enterolobii]
MKRISSMIDDKMRNFRNEMADCPHSFISNAVIGHQLYGSLDENDQENDLKERLDELKILQILKEKKDVYWLGLFCETFNSTCICVIGNPSSKMFGELLKEEEERKSVRKDQLGEEGLSANGEILSQSIIENEENKPTYEVIRQFIPQDLGNFRLIPVCSDVLKGWPIHTTWHEITSEFYEAHILFDTQKIPASLRKYLHLWSEAIFMSCATIDNVDLTVEEVADKSKCDLFHKSISFGISNYYKRFVTLKLSSEEYHKLVKWTKVYLKQIKFDSADLLICSQILINEAAEYNFDGNSSMDLLTNFLTYDMSSNEYMINKFASFEFHKAVETSLKADKIVVTNQLNKLHNYILQSLVNLHLVGIKKNVPLDSIRGDEWEFLKSELFPQTQHQCDANYGQSWQLGDVQMAFIGGAENIFLTKKAKFRDDWNGDTTMETLLLSKYLSQAGGPLWNNLRGRGLCYTSTINVVPDQKSIIMNLNKCSNLEQAFNRLSEVVRTVLEEEFDECYFESAKRSLIFDLIKDRSSIKSTIDYAILASLRKLNNGFTKDIYTKVWYANKKDVRINGATPIKNLLDEQNSFTALTISANKRREVEEFFPEIKEASTVDLKLSEELMEEDE